MLYLPTSGQLQITVDSCLPDESLQCGDAAISSLENSPGSPLENDSASPPAGAISQAIRFEHDRTNAAPREMIGGRHTCETATDDRDLGRRVFNRARCRDFHSWPRWFTPRSHRRFTLAYFPLEVPKDDSLYENLHTKTVSRRARKRSSFAARSAGERRSGDSIDRVHRA